MEPKAWEDQIVKVVICFVHENAKVCGDAQVYDNAEVYDNAYVNGDA